MEALANDIRGWATGAMPAPRPWYTGLEPSEAEAVVHLVDFEPDALTGLPDVFAAAGVSTRVHASPTSFAESHPADAPGCVVLHAGCAQIGQPDFFAEFRRKANGVPIILAMDRADTRTVVLAMKAGAVDFVETSFCDRDILAAVEGAIRIDRRRRQAEASSAELLRRFRTLTPREREVMALVTQGRLNKQAAGDLGLSEITVKAHRGSVTRKMAARTIADLVRMADLLAGMSAADTDIFESPRG